MLTIISINIEGLSAAKEEIVSEICKKNKCAVLCMQETHRGVNKIRPHVVGMTLVAERPHDQYGSAMFVRDGTVVAGTSLSEVNNVETLSVQFARLTVTSIYKPPNEMFKITDSPELDNPGPHVLIGDYNSHSTQWGYNETNEDGRRVENWAEAKRLKLIHDSKQPPSFNSCRWKRGYNPDLAFVSEVITGNCRKRVLDPIPKTQHRPIAIDIREVITPIVTPFRRRFNFKKARWQLFANDLDDHLQSSTTLRPQAGNYNEFVKCAHKSACRNIPRGCRTRYVPGLSLETSKMYTLYKTQYEQDMFAEDTITMGEQLMMHITEERRRKWQEMIEQTDFTHNSKKAWATIHKLSSDTTKACTLHKDVTANQIAHQLILNGRGSDNRLKESIPKPIKQDIAINSFLVHQSVHH